MGEFWGSCPHSCLGGKHLKSFWMSDEKKVEVGDNSVASCFPPGQCFRSSPGARSPWYCEVQVLKDTFFSHKWLHLKGDSLTKWLWNGQMSWVHNQLKTNIRTQNWNVEESWRNICQMIWYFPEISHFDLLLFNCCDVIQYYLEYKGFHGIIALGELFSARAL